MALAIFSAAFVNIRAACLSSAGVTLGTRPTGGIQITANFVLALGQFVTAAVRECTEIGIRLLDTAAGHGT